LIETDSAEYDKIMVTTLSTKYRQISIKVDSTECDQILVGTESIVFNHILVGANAAEYAKFFEFNYILIVVDLVEFQPELIRPNFN